MKINTTHDLNIPFLLCICVFQTNIFHPQFLRKNKTWAMARTAALGFGMVAQWSASRQRADTGGRYSRGNIAQGIPRVVGNHIQQCVFYLCPEWNTQNWHVHRHMAWAWHELVTAGENTVRGSFLHSKTCYEMLCWSVQSCFCATGFPKARLDAGATDSNKQNTVLPKPSVNPMLLVTQTL